jgi:hypothetical protein
LLLLALELSVALSQPFPESSSFLPFHSSSFVLCNIAL